MEGLMNYYLQKTMKGISFEDAIDVVTEELKKEGFGIITEIDFKDTLKKKIDASIKNYHILGACNPHFAYKAFKKEDKVGVLLPCNVVVTENEDGDIEVAALNSVVAMEIADDEELKVLAEEVLEKIKRVLAEL